MYIDCKPTKRDNNITFNKTATKAFRGAIVPGKYNNTGCNDPQRGTPCTVRRRYIIRDTCYTR